MYWRDLNEKDVCWKLGSCHELRKPADKSKPLVVVVDQTVTHGGLKSLQRLIKAKSFTISGEEGNTVAIAFEFADVKNDAVCSTCQEVHRATQSDGGWQMLAHIPSFASVACEGTGTFPQTLVEAPQWARDDFYRQADGEDR